MYLLYPISLLAVIGIIIPIVIHLWNIKSGKTLKIGSIALLGKASNQRSTHFKVSDWPLLLLRCLLLGLLAFLLAGPFRQSSHATAQEQGWVLLEKQHLKRIWGQHKIEIDSLLKKGYGLHDFNTGFAKLNLQDTATTFSLPAALPLSYFSLIRQLDAQKRPGTKIYLYTDPYFQRFEGNKPYTHLILNWKGVVPADTSAAQLPTPDRARMQVLINSNGLQLDAAYLRSALYAIAEYSKRPIEIKEIRSLNQIKSPATLVFWLSEKVPDARALQQLPAGITFFNYAGKKIEKLRSAVQYHTGSNSQQVALYQRRQIDHDSGQAVWKDAFGTPLLSLDTSSKINHYQFYSRFNQNWTELVWSNGLAEALLPIVLPHTEPLLGFPQNAEHTLSPVPLPISNKIKTAQTYLTQQSLSALFWWLLLIVFFIERWITYRKAAYRS